MKYFFTCFIVILLTSCAQPPVKETVKIKPTFTSEITDPELKVIVGEYIKLSTRYNIRFIDKVSIGFSKINRGNVIGTCTYRPDFREIDLDYGFWKDATWLSKLALVYHELSHCYCERDHDFGDGTKYPINSIQSIIEEFMAKQPLSPLKPEGYFDDSCPQTVMHPIILENYCFEKHYSFYVKEMFARCVPY